MFYAYVLKSNFKDYYYKGHCSNLDVRIQQHNAGKTKSLRPYLPVELIYFEAFDKKEPSIEAEKNFKTAACRRFLRNKLATNK